MYPTFYSLFTDDVIWLMPLFFFNDLRPLVNNNGITSHCKFSTNRLWKMVKILLLPRTSHIVLVWCSVVTKFSSPSSHNVLLHFTVKLGCRSHLWMGGQWFVLDSKWLWFGQTIWKRGKKNFFAPRKLAHAIGTYIQLQSVLL